MKSGFPGELGAQVEKLVKPFGSSGNLQAYNSDPSALRSGNKKEGALTAGVAMTDAAVGAVEEKERPVIGVLSKWVNLGRGWGPRLFVLEEVSADGRRATRYGMLQSSEAFVTTNGLLMSRYELLQSTH